MDDSDPRPVQEDSGNETESDGIDEKVGVERGMVPPLSPAILDLTLSKLEDEGNGRKDAHHPTTP